jgi:hypothetical protein
MRRRLIIAPMLAIGSLAFVTEPASAASHGYAHSKPAPHHHVARDAGEITNFSSSSPAGLNVGVNHPPKK